MLSSLILFFLGFIYSYFFYKDSQKTYEITVAIDGSFEKMDYYYVWNSGKNTIYKGDLLTNHNLIEVFIEENHLIEFAQITDKTSPYFKMELFNNSKDLKIEFDFLRPNEGFTLMIKSKFVDKPATYWHIPIKQKKDVVYFPKTIKARGKLSNFYLFNNLLNYASLSFFVVTSIVIGKIDFSNLDGWVEYFNAIWLFFLLGFIIFMTPTMFTRIRAPRPPIELELHYIEHNKENQKLLKVLIRLIQKIKKKIRQLYKP